MFSHLVINYLFVFSVIVIWFMLGYQFILFLLGYLYGFRAQRKGRQLEQSPLELPAISLMVPAHNEEMVITQTIERC
jgi:cellulose synthase/poly-beta-1,6-N-acetylglucosamine synthase-like glycosyltransferase